MVDIIKIIMGLYDSLLSVLLSDVGKIILGAIFAVNTILIIIILIDYKNEKERGIKMNYVLKKRFSPLLKYPGGKVKELQYIIPSLPNKIKGYYEPFVGGGAVFFALDCEKYYINDKSTDLICVYEKVKNQEVDFLENLKAINHNWSIITDVMMKHGEELVEIYYHYKNNQDKVILQEELTKFLNCYADDFNGMLSPTFNVEIQRFINTLINSVANKMIRMRRIEETKGDLILVDIKNNIECSIRSAFYVHFRYLYNNKDKLTEISRGVATAIFLFIRQYCYAGMFRYNKKGEFNVPYGGISYNSKSLQNKLEMYESKEMIEHFSKTNIYNMDFYDFILSVPPQRNDFIFLDPPYDTEFSTYDKNEFGKDDQIRLANYLIKECEANFMLVIKNTEFISSLYPENHKTKNGDKLYLSSFDKKYLVSFQGRNKQDAEHLVITNYRIESI